MLTFFMEYMQIENWKFPYLYSFDNVRILLIEDFITGFMKCYTCQNSLSTSLAEEKLLVAHVLHNIREGQNCIF